MTLDLITASRLRSYRRCARLHSLKYVDRWKPANYKSDALSIGNAFHLAVEHWWNSSPVDLEPGRSGSPVSWQWLEDLDAIQAAKVDAMVAGYIRHAWPDRDQWEVLEVEKEFRLPLIHPSGGGYHEAFDLGGKIDLVLRHRATGHVYVVDHKTTSYDVSDDASRVFQGLPMDDQMSVYVLGAASLGYTVEGIIYDVAKKPMLRQRKDELVAELADRMHEDVNARPGVYFRRVNAHRSESDINDALADMWADADRIAADMKRHRYPRNPSACFNFQRRCEYWDICALGVDPESSTLYVRGEAHTELTEVTKPKEATT